MLRPFPLTYAIDSKPTLEAFKLLERIALKEESELGPDALRLTEQAIRWLPHLFEPFFGREEQSQLYVVAALLANIYPNPLRYRKVEEKFGAEVAKLLEDHTGATFENGCFYCTEGPILVFGACWAAANLHVLYPDALEASGDDREAYAIVWQTEQGPLTRNLHKHLASHTHSKTLAVRMLSSNIARWDTLFLP